MKRKTGRGPKDKGRAFENEVVNTILAAFLELSEHDVLARSMGDIGADIILSEAARIVLPLAIECKRIGKIENLNLMGAMKQAKANVQEGLLPVVVYREDRHETLATMQLSGLMEVVRHQNMGDYRPDILVTLKWADLLKLLGGKQ